MHRLTKTGGDIQLPLFFMLFFLCGLNGDAMVYTKCRAVCTGSKPGDKTAT